MINTYKTNYLQQSGHGLDFTIKVVDLPNKFDNYYVESCRAAEHIYANRTGKLHLLYSGGLDSEYMVSIFLDLKMDVVPVIIRLNNNYNEHDIQNAFRFCESKNINPLIVDIDFDDFVMSGKLLDITQQIKSSQYQYAVTAYVAGLLDGTVLIGEGEPYIKLNDISRQWDIIIYEYEQAIDNYFKQQGIYGTSYFNRYSSEMFLSFLNDDRCKELASNLVPGKLSSFSSKYIVYNRHSNFNLRSRSKYHGYEIIERSEIFNHDAFKEIEKFSKNYNGVYSVDYFEFMKAVK
jgi:hypothetical protein